MKLLVACIPVMTLPVMAANIQVASPFILASLEKHVRHDAPVFHTVLG
jgi:hypothetical protein